MKYLDAIDKIHPDLLKQFFSSGDAPGIPEEIKNYLRQLTWSAEIYEFERNISRAAKQLQIRILAIQHVKVDERTCKERIYSAINYFSIDNNVSIKVWESNYADKYEDLAKLCAFNRDYKTQQRCYEAALECRRRASEIANADRDLGVIFLITPDLKPEDIGYRKKSLKDIARKYNDGFYAKLIEGLPIESVEKKRLLRDADIEDVSFDELNMNE